MCNSSGRHWPAFHRLTIHCRIDYIHMDELVLLL